MLRTTINMRISIFDKISRAADQLGKPRREIVILLLSRIRRDFRRYPGGFTLVKYQPREMLNLWHPFTITYKEEENELVTDFRKFGKLSVSYFVAIATERYLDELLADGGKSHNYVPIDHYALGKRVQNGVCVWETYWGDPGNPGKMSGNTKIHRRIGGV
ncbi:MAG: hypothetical protein EPN93_20675 [Spirochaetes bacterium]|nr:MAG: hypothetical protein EPN93_20675 [Spirochaetota bacterium]